MFHRRGLATQVRHLYGQPKTDSTFSEAAYDFQPGDTFAISTMFPFRDGPRARTEYRIPDPRTRWTYATTTPESTYNAIFPEPAVLPMLLSDPHLTAYPRGQHQRLVTAKAPVAPAPNPAVPIQRAGDLLHLMIDGFTDALGNHGLAYSDASGVSTHLEIRADGTVVAETDNYPGGTLTMPAGDSNTEVEFDMRNPQSWNRLSTHTDTTWSFPSTTTTNNEIVTEPVIEPSYDVKLDQRNRWQPVRSHKLAFDLRLWHVAGAADPRIGHVTLDGSYDRGHTWEAGHPRP